jgi:predicted phosphodiesterase
MKLAIISDTHFGDPAGTLIEQTPSGRYVPGPKYEAFAEAAGVRNDYLVLNGDVMDFATGSYDGAYKTAKAFFQQIQRDRIARQIIYLPGNHDFEIWQIVEHQVNIIYQMSTGQMPRKFRMSVPGFIDDRRRVRRRGLLLPGVRRRRIRGKLGYGGLFLDTITGRGDAATRFSFAYPNLYVVTDNESVLITHGHYLDAYWSALGRLAPKIFRQDLATGDPMSLADMVAVNFPSTQLACSGVGQAGVLTDTIRSVEAQILKKQLDRVRLYLKRAEQMAEKAVGGSALSLKRWVTVASLAWARNRALEYLGQMEDPRVTRAFIHGPAVRERLRHFYEGSALAIDELNRRYACDIPYPTHLITGHTHQPVPWKSAEATGVKCPDGKTLLASNSGGWLTGTFTGGGADFHGAEVFIYETGKGFSSVSIR